MRFQFVKLKQFAVIKNKTDGKKQSIAAAIKKPYDNFLLGWNVLTVEPGKDSKTKKIVTALESEKLTIIIRTRVVFPEMKRSIFCKTKMRAEITSLGRGKLSLIPALGLNK